MRSDHDGSADPPGDVGFDAVVVSPASLGGRLDPSVLLPGAAAIELDLGFGYGRFLVEAARGAPERGFIGIESSRRLLRRVRDRVVRLGLANVRLAHGDSKDVVGRLLPPESVVRVHVHFPDPWPKRRHAKHRLFAGTFPDDLARVLVPGGQLLLATDHDPYFREVVARLLRSPSFVRVTPDPFRGLPMTGFESLFASGDVPAFKACWERVP